MCKVRAWLKIKVLSTAIWIAKRAWDIEWPDVDIRDLAVYKTLLYMREVQLTILKS